MFLVIGIETEMLLRCNCAMQMSSKCDVLGLHDPAHVAMDGLAMKEPMIKESLVVIERLPVMHGTPRQNDFE